MWAYSQWTMERMVGIWGAMVKLRSNAARNLALNVFRTQQFHMVRYALHLDKNGRDGKPLMTVYAPKHDETSLIDDDNDKTATYKPSWNLLMQRLYSSPNEVEAEIKLRVCCAPGYDSTLHDRQKNYTLSAAEIQLLTDCLSSWHYVPVDKCPEKNKPFKAEMWKKCLRNDAYEEQASYKAYIRSAKYEDAAARDSTYIMFEDIEITNYDGRRGQRKDTPASKFARVQYFMVYRVPGVDPNIEGSTYTLAFIHEIPCSSIEMRRISGENRYSNTLKLYKMVSKGGPVPAKQKRFIHTEKIRGLMGIVESKGERFFVSRNSCFL